MKKKYFYPDTDGFYGVYYPNPKPCQKAMIAMLGDSSDDHMAVSGVKWLYRQGLNVMAMSPDKKDYGHHDYPLERIERAVAYLKAAGNEKIGIVGVSTTGMVALASASLFPEITLTIAMTPPDFIMEGFLQDGRDGAKERPSDGSSLSWKGKPLLPIATRSIGSRSWPIPKQVGIKSPADACLRNRSGGTPFRRKNGSKLRTSRGSSFLWVRRTMCCGIPANLSTEC